MSTMLDSWPEPDRESIGERLRAYMGVHKISRAKLAVASGINRQSLSTKLDGQVDFTIDDITKIARALNRSWLWVVSGLDVDPDGDDGGSSGAPTRARTWDLRIIRPEDRAEVADIRRHVPEKDAA
ncbi:transcriptional repressor [Mycobacterium phage Rem711]|uniref:Immunity repressor n=1 Tax=Mycobacterium phage Rem711 TaxID=2079285 RepID=A0A2K9VEZ1_9CAUD|nr:transcriptional repressor [Mycobacterium phage Rem711]AUV60825.1 immunity repressor [Mycobacterium phage Rem711]